MRLLARFLMFSLLLLLAACAEPDGDSSNPGIDTAVVRTVSDQESTLEMTAAPRPSQTQVPTLAPTATPTPASASTPAVTLKLPSSARGLRTGANPESSPGRNSAET